MKETPEQRTRIMRAVKDRNSQAEMTVRRLVHAMGYRFRLHRADLPGKPDLVFARLRKVIFVHGCFWHGHKCRRGDRLPKNNQDYWRNKIGRNRERDRAVKKALSKAGWKVAVVWECEIGKPERLTKKLTAFL